MQWNVSIGDLQVGGGGQYFQPDEPEVVFVNGARCVVDCDELRSLRDIALEVRRKQVRDAVAEGLLYVDEEYQAAERAAAEQADAEREAKFNAIRAEVAELVPRAYALLTRVLAEA